MFNINHTKKKKQQEKRKKSVLWVDLLCVLPLSKASLPDPLPVDSLVQEVWEKAFINTKHLKDEDTVLVQVKPV